MQTLTFNTTTKIVQLLDGQLLSQSKILQIYENVSTVRCSELGFYEVMQKDISATEEIQIPICRLPIPQTIMFINK